MRYIYATSDYGKKWRKLVSGIPDGSFGRAVREDPVKKGLLFAGTERDMYWSKDAGEHWESLQLNLPTVPVQDLVIKDNDLLLATHARAFWILDDISPLRQATDSVVKADLWMYQPSLALRLHGSEEKESPTEGANAPVGAYLFI